MDSESSMSGVYVVTNCTVSRTEEALVKISNMTRGVTMAAALEQWCQMLDSCSRLVTPRELYKGQGMQQIQRMLPQIGAEHVRIVTGGQGLIKLEEEIAPYDFTANPKEPFSIHNVVTKEPFNIPLWWVQINEKRKGIAFPLAELLEAHDTKLVIIAVQKFFFRYLVDDIVRASPEGIRKLRILKTSSSTGYIPTRLRYNVIQMPYSAFNASVGNRNDIPQRACLQFVELIETHELIEAPVEDQQALVSQVFGNQSPSVRGPGSQVFESFTPVEGTTDEEAAALAAMASINIGAPKSAEKTGIDEVDKTIGLFLTMLTKQNKGAAFTTSDFYTWLTAYYGALKKELPVWAQSKARAGQYIAQSYGRFGLEKFNVGSSSLGYYRLKPSMPELIGAEPEHINE